MLRALEPVEMAAEDRSRARALLDRIAAEIVDCADMTASLQETVCPDRTDLAACDIVALQSLDLIDQTLRNLATILTRVSGNVPAGARVDLGCVLRDCTLAALSCRLGGDEAPSNDEDFELF